LVKIIVLFYALQRKDFARKERDLMNLMLKIEGKEEAVRDFITFMKTDERYAIYASARYLLSPNKDIVKFVFEKQAGGMRSGESTDHAAQKRHGEKS
jgi:hypothetical protein